MEQIVSKYLKQLNIPISKKYCEKLIASHPDYPSLLSIADTLQRLGINHRVIRIGKEHLEHLPFPCLIYPEGDSKNGELRFIEDKDDLSTRDAEFSSAVVLQAQPTDTIADRENEKQRSDEMFKQVMTGILLTVLAGLLLLTSISNMTWMYDLLLLTALGGTATGYLLIAKDLGITYESVEAFCNAGQKTNCDRILSSEEAKIFGGITFSDAAASYFLFQTLMIGLFIPLSGSIASYYGVLALLSVLAIPVVIYSFYYQMVKAGTWCRLCLLVDGILIIQAALFGYVYEAGIIPVGSVSSFSAVLTLFLFAAIGSGLVLVKSILEKAGKSERAEVSANRIKYDPDIFLSLLQRKKHVDTTPFEQEMVIGDPEAPINIIMAASLSCGPCKRGFEKATRLVDAWPGKVSFVVRFRTVSGNNGKQTPGDCLLEYWLQHIHGQPKASARTEQLLRDWYDLMDLEQFKKRYPLESEDESRAATTEALKEQHAGWIDRTEIKATPTFFVNGRRLPEQYSVEDLTGIIPGLTAHMESQEMGRRMSLETETENVQAIKSRDNRG